MMADSRFDRYRFGARLFMMVLAMFLLISSDLHAAFSVNVTGKDDSSNTTQSLTDFKWLVQEDNTHKVPLGVYNNYSSQSVSIFNSHAKVLASGTGANPVVNLPGDGRYFVSVLANGYTMSGAAVRPGQSSVNVLVHKLPIPLAQVSVFVFEDNAPINGAPDAPAERPLPGFKIMVFDQAGQMMSDAFNNPIGTIYNPDGTVKTMGMGYVVTTATGDNLSGNATIPNLTPGKYGIRAVPDDGKPWIQTSTIEGTPGIDVWVRAGEPPYFTEAGFFNVHAFIGFVLPTSYAQGPQLPVGGTATVKGQVVKNRYNRPPNNWGLFPGEPVPDAYIGLSDTGNGNAAVYVTPCDADGSFNVANVPPGNYSLTMWDRPLDNIIDFRTVVVPPAGGTIDLGKIPVYQWFGTLEGAIFNDLNQNGVKDPGEPGISNLGMNIRFRDGSIYQATVTGPAGDYAFTEVFPFFKWLVVESDYSRLKPTGSTSYVDKGGTTIFNPANPASLLEVRTDLGSDVVLQGMKLYFGQTAMIDWGRTEYKPGENGGISGVVYYAASRPNENPKDMGASALMPGIPDVEVRLYRVSTDQAGKRVLEGPIATTMSDSWDKNRPTGCMDTLRQHADILASIAASGIPMDKYIDCSETMPTWNQIKPAVFDGGYIFTADSAGNPLSAGDYAVEVVPPPGYEIVKEEDQNVFFGETYTPSVPQPAALAPACIGPDHVVPQFLSFDGTLQTPLYSVLPYPQKRPLCSTRLVRLQDGQNAATDFFLFTQVPAAGRMVGLVTDDLTLEFRKGNPRLSDKVGPSFMPISIQDFNGNEIVRTYTDEWGQYNTLIPATYTMNVPNPTGISPHMVRVVLNYPGTPENPDPFYNPGYPQAPWQFDIWPAKTTYVDTPIIPIRPNFPAPGGVALDCAQPDGTPVIKMVNGPAGGPWIETAPGQLTITSMGAVNMPNPDTAVGGSITRSYGFGATAGSVYLDDGTTRTMLSVVNWSDSTITATVPVGATTGQLVVTRGDNYKRTVTGVTVHLGVPAAKVRKVAAGQSIQAAIDAATPGDLILIAPGLYPENLFMYKPVNLQGYGAESTIIRPPYLGPERLAVWNAKLTAVTTNNGAINVPPDQNPYLIPGERPDFFLENGSVILVLASNKTSPSHVAFSEFSSTNKSRIDGLQLTGAVLGGGIFVNAYADSLQITNNKIFANQGTFGGGIRIGTPSVVDTNGVFGPPSTSFVGSANGNIRIANNEIMMNGANGLAIASGGGIGIYKGTDNYLIENSWICGNYSMLAGSGIGHQGVSSNGLIRNNSIILNEAFDEGAGVFIAGEFPIQAVGGVGGTTLTEGTGSVRIHDNLIQGNKAGNLGGGIAIVRQNGLDVSANPTNTAPVAPATTPAQWYMSEMYNNLVVNNLSGGYGGGIALFDALDSRIVHNTIANNDATATGELAFGNIPWLTEGATLPADAKTNPMPAGIGVQPFSAVLLGTVDAGLRGNYDEVGVLASPALVNNLVANNRAFYWNGTEILPYATWDLGVFGHANATGAPVKLQPGFSLLTNTAENAAIYTGNGNAFGDPKFVNDYRNTISATQGGAALGNFVAYTYSPQALQGNYHLKGTSAARSVGTAALPVPVSANTILAADSDGDPRGPAFDAGADQFNSKGDVNGDGVVTVADALLALRLVAGLVPQAQVTADMLLNVHVYPLDINGRPAGGSAAYNPPATNTVSINDALLILQRAIGVTIW